MSTLPITDTVHRIAEALLMENRSEATAKIAPMLNCYGPAALASFADAWAEVQTLRRQCAELRVLFPAKAEQFSREFDATVLAIAGELRRAHEEISE
jgi:hypothetical protein